MPAAILLLMSEQAKFVAESAYPIGRVGIIGKDGVESRAIVEWTDFGDGFAGCLHAGGRLRGSAPHTSPPIPLALLPDDLVAELVSCFAFRPVELDAGVDGGHWVRPCVSTLKPRY